MFALEPLTPDEQASMEYRTQANDTTPLDSDRISKFFTPTTHLHCLHCLDKYVTYTGLTVHSLEHHKYLPLENRDGLT